MITLRALGLAGIALALCGCSVESRRGHVLGCRPGEQQLSRDTLYFGASIPGGGEVDAADWQQFENEVLVPAFPDGYTVVPASGVWRDREGMTTREASRIVVVIHADTAASTAASSNVATRYRGRFRQESVLQEHDVVCARF